MMINGASYRRCRTHSGVTMGLRTSLMIGVAALVLASCAQPGTGYFRPDLNDGVIARVVTGQTGQEVAALLGQPHSRLRFENLKSTAWDYLYRDSWGYWVAFSVMMGDDDRVLGKVSRRIEPPDRN